VKVVSDPGTYGRVEGRVASAAYSAFGSTIRGDTYRFNGDAAVRAVAPTELVFRVPTVFRIVEAIAVSESASWYWARISSVPS